MSSYIKSGICLAFTTLHIQVDGVLGKKVDNDVLKVSPADVTPTVTPRQSHDTRDLENAVPRYSRDTVADHCYTDSCWIVVNNRVYDVTRFLRQHPGGEDIILEHGGYDATRVFIDKGHSRGAHQMLEEFYIGDVTEEDWMPELEVP